MAARCFNDTCSTTVTETTNPSAFEIDVNIDTTHSIQCTNGVGLQVRLSEDTAVANDPDFNYLRRDASGYLHTIAPGVTTYRFTNPAERGIPHNTNDVSQSIGNKVLSNPYSVPVLALIRGRFQLNFGIADNPSIDDITSATDFVPHNANIVFKLFVDSAPLPDPMPQSQTGADVSVYIPVGGVTYDIGDVQYKRAWHDFNLEVQIAAGASVYLADIAFHDGVDQRLNVLTNPVTDDAGVNVIGYRTAFLNATLIPATSTISGSY